MHVGDLSVTAYKRSVRKQLDTEWQARQIPLSQASRVQAWESKEKPYVLTAQASVTGRSPSLGRYGSMQALNELALKQAKAQAVMLQVFMPDSMREKKLELLIEETKTYCHAFNIPVTDVITQVLPGISQMIVNVQAVGTASMEDISRMMGNLSKQSDTLSIIQCGLAGLEGSLRILDERRKVLSERFTQSFLNECADKQRELLSMTQIEKILEEDILYAEQIKSGGIFASLWNISEAFRTGFNIDLQAVDLCQETVELLEYFHLNPYQMTSAGSILIVTRDGEEVLGRIQSKGIRASKLGVISQDKAKIITSRTEERFLDRPAPDELMLFWERELS